MPYRSKVTTDHETIRAWAEERGGRPSHIKGIGAETEETDILRIDFGEPDAGLEKISWKKFFDIFEEHRLAFLYQEQTKEGEESRFHKFVYRDEAAASDEDPDDYEDETLPIPTTDRPAGEESLEEMGEREAKGQGRNGGGDDDEEEDAM